MVPIENLFARLQPAVYLQPIDMEPRGMGLPAAKADIHLEADIHAVEGSKNGFGAGEWIPYLTISYTLVNSDTGEKQEGTFMPGHSVCARVGPDGGGGAGAPRYAGLYGAVYGESGHLH